MQQGLGRDPHGGEIFCFRGRKGDLVKLIWHDGVGMSLYMKRLEAGKFIWPTSGSGEAVRVSAAQIGYLLEQAAERHRSERGREHRLAQSALDAEARKGRIKPCHDVIFLCLRGRHDSLLP
ncbi:IS66 family insertion sequence element accessory protein TnpB [Poseidonocella sp. HB161398]|uniref:IS66 family insertion sequence element accessory protein TnpB n=1 Tax=Poseidonocella sp. HB161398 TaxID=2320855 RepID=UPI0019800F4C|nr:IS66 family insertion sequence element accessory protein TnpB [Poseidonocella sp. HB161398]